MNRNRLFFIADDDVDDQELFIQALHEIDDSCSYITASNGQETIDKLFDRQLSVPDLIFLDLNMPRLNGKQCLQKIKSNQRIQQVPVIIYSTSAFQQDIDETTLLGAAFFLQKPSRFNDLRNALEKILNYSWDKSS